MQECKTVEIAGSVHRGRPKKTRTEVIKNRPEGNKDKWKPSQR